MKHRYRVIEYFTNVKAASNSFAVMIEVNKMSGMLWWKKDCSTFEYVDLNGKETWFQKDIAMFEKYEDAQAFIDKLGGEVVL